jgi:hypothetical protein
MKNKMLYASTINKISTIVLRTVAKGLYFSEKFNNLYTPKRHSKRNLYDKREFEKY